MKLTPRSPEFERLRQEDCSNLHASLSCIKEFQACLCDRARSRLKKAETKTNKPPNLSSTQSSSNRISAEVSCTLSDIYSLKNAYTYNRARHIQNDLQNNIS